MRISIKIAILAAATFPSFAAEAQAAGQIGVFRNPQNSVHVRIYTCGKGRCATVVWANDKAKADSARGGTKNLVGTELFRDFRQVSAKVWKGKVFVPDLNAVFSGTATVKDQDTIVARGCLFGNFGCKSQAWTRVN